MLLFNFSLPKQATDLTGGLPPVPWRRGQRNFLTALLSLATLISCAAPAPEPLNEAAVVQPEVTCRVDRDGGPMVTDRGIGGTGRYFDMSAEATSVDLDLLQEDSAGYFGTSANQLILQAFAMSRAGQCGSATARISVPDLRSRATAAPTATPLSGCSGPRMAPSL